MPGFGSTPVSTTALGANQFPVSAVAVPGETGGNLTAFEGGPESTDSNGNKTAPGSVYVKDGGNVAQGTTTDAAYTSGAGTVIALLKKLVAELAAVLTVAGTITEANSAAILTDIAAIQASVANIPSKGQALAAASTPVVLTASQLTTLTPPTSITVSNFPGSQAVTGTFWQATQPISGSVSVSNFPATQPVSGTFWQTTQPVSGSVSISNFPATQPVSAASLPLPTGASTAAKQPALGTAGTPSTDVLTIQGIASMTPLKMDGSGVTQPVSGSVSISNFPASQAVTGTFWQATQPVSGTVTANAGTNLNTSLLALEAGHLATIDTNTGNIPGKGQATMVNSLPVVIASNQSAVPVSGTFWQATQPISGTITVTQAAGANLHAILDASSAVIGHVIVDSSISVDVIATGNLTVAQPTVATVVAGGTVSIALGDGQSTFEAQLTGTFSGGTTIQFEGTDESGTTTNWFSTVGYNTAVVNPPAITSIAGPGPFIIRGSAAGYQQIRMRASALTALDNVSVRLVGTTAALGIGGLLTNDGSFAKETGGNLASIVTNTTNNATSALQTTGNTSLASIVTSTGNIPAKGQATMANSTPVTIASDQTSVPFKRSTVAAYTWTSAATTGTTQNSGDIAVGAYTEIALDINTTAQSGTNPTIQFFYERKGADGIYYVLWQSAVLTAATNTLSTSIGSGMAYNQSLGVTGRVRWVVGGSATPTFTMSINVQGK